MDFWLIGELAGDGRIGRPDVCARRARHRACLQDLRRCELRARRDRHDRRLRDLGFCRPGRRPALGRHSARARHDVRGRLPDRTRRAATHGRPTGDHDHHGHLRHGDLPARRHAGFLRRRRQTSRPRHPPGTDLPRRNADQPRLPDRRRCIGHSHRRRDRAVQFARRHRHAGGVRRPGCVVVGRYPGRARHRDCMGAGRRHTRRRRASCGARRKASTGRFRSC